METAKKAGKNSNGKRKRRVCFVWNYSNWGGAQIYFLSIIRTAKKFYDVKVIMPANSEQHLFDYLEKDRIEYELLPAQKNLTSAPTVFGKLKVHFDKIRAENQLVRQISARDLSNTILHVDLGFWQSFLPLFRLARKTPVFTTIHTALPEISGWRRIVWNVKGTLISKAKNYHFLASNEDARKSLRPYISAEKFAETQVAYSGISRAEFELIAETEQNKGETLRRYDLPADKILIFSVGQFIERKGCWVVLEALKKIKPTQPDIYFVWLGTAATDRETTEKIESFDVKENFRLMSAAEIGKSRAELLTLFSVADVFVLASSQEGLPIALVEAMALEKPCISTRVGAIPEALENDFNGILIEPNDSEQLAEAVIRLAKDRDSREVFGKRAKEKAFAEFEETKSAAVTLEKYSEAFG